MHEIDDHLDEQAKRTQERYDNFERDRLGMDNQTEDWEVDKSLPDGWKVGREDNSLPTG